MSAMGLKRTFQSVLLMSALPSKADTARRDQDVCFGPKADKVQRSTVRALFDHLISAGNQRLRHVEAQRLCGLEVDESSIFVSCWTGRSAGFSPLRIRST